MTTDTRTTNGGTFVLPVTRMLSTAPLSDGRRTLGVAMVSTLIHARSAGENVPCEPRFEPKNAEGYAP